MFTQLQRVAYQNSRLPLPEGLHAYEARVPSGKWHLIRIPMEWLADDSDRALITAALHADRISRTDRGRNLGGILANCYTGHLAELAVRRALERTLLANGLAATVTSFDEVRESVLDAENEFDLRINNDVISVKSTTLSAADDPEIRRWLEAALSAPPRVDLVQLRQWRWHCLVLFVIERRTSMAGKDLQLAHIRKLIRERAIHPVLVGGVDTEYLINQQLGREHRAAASIRFGECADGWRILSRMCQLSA